MRIYYWALYFGDDEVNSIASVHNPAMDGDINESVCFTAEEVTLLNDVFTLTPAPIFSEDRFERQIQLRAFSDEIKKQVRDGE